MDNKTEVYPQPVRKDPQYTIVPLVMLLQSMNILFLFRRSWRLWQEWTWDAWGWSDQANLEDHNRGPYHNQLMAYCEYHCLHCLQLGRTWIDSPDWCEWEWEPHLCSLWAPWHYCWQVSSHHHLYVILNAIAKLTWYFSFILQMASPSHSSTSLNFLWNVTLSHILSYGERVPIPDWLLNIN